MVGTELLDHFSIAKLYPELPDIFKNGLEKIDGIFEPTKRLDLNGIASLYFVIIEKVPEIKEEEVARGDTKINISVKWTGEETRVTSKCKGDILRELGGKICYRAESADFQAKVTYQKKIKDSFSSEVAAGYLNFTVTGDRYLSFNWARPFGSSLLSPNKEQIGKAIRKSAHLFVKE